MTHSPDFATSPVPIWTYLFRENAHLDESLEVAASSWAQHGALERFTVHVVASSYGLEADSAVAYIDKCMPEVGSVALTGFDPRAEAVATARRGVYLFQPDQPEYSAVIKNILQNYGFSVETTPPKGYPRMAGLFVNGLSMRQRHDVAFVNTDYLDVRGQFGQPDLILCNNLLYHLHALRPKRATQMLDHMTGQMKDGSVLSIETEHGLDDDYDEYRRWRKNIVPKLAELSIFAHDPTAVHPHIFKKIAA